MACLEEFCAFRATMALIEERGLWQLVNDTYLACKREITQEEPSLLCNRVRDIYEPFSVEEINEKIVEMLCPKGMQTPIELVFQSIEGLHEACPNHPGDWYFTGHYPTPGGTRLCNKAFVNYIDNKQKQQ
jgi:amidophosphoribosyltransferase